MDLLYEDLSYQIRGAAYDVRKNYGPGHKEVLYQPDFIVDDKIIVELKALENIPRKMIDQLYSYLRNSIYQLGFFINYGPDGVDIKRVIYTNDRKSHIQKEDEIPS